MTSRTSTALVAVCFAAFAPHDAWPSQNEPLPHGSAFELGSRLADQFTAANPADSLGWDWGPGVFLYGLAKFESALAAQNGESRYQPYLRDYYDHWRAKGVPAPADADGCGPALGALPLAAMGDPSGVAALTPVVHYLQTEPRDALGAIDHLGHSFFSHVYPSSIWVDSLMMTSVFAAQWGAAKGDAALLAFGAAQPAIYASVLQDSATGLFWHAWNIAAHRTIPDTTAFWLRGNGWVAVSIVELVDLIGPNAPQSVGLLRILAKQAEGLARFQRPDGLWGTLANRPDYAYPETSGSALLAYAWAKAAHRGWLGPEYLARAIEAFAGVSTYLKPAQYGLSLGGISGPTNPGPDYSYWFMPQGADLPYGVGAYLLAASELALSKF